VGACFVLALCAVAASAFLAYVSFTKIDAICLYCHGLYVLNLAWLALATAMLWRSRLAPWRAVLLDARAAWEHVGKVAALLAPFLVAVALLVPLFPKYWQTGAASRLEVLPTGTTEQGEHWIGAKSPAVTIVEYTDYECPFCRRAHKEIRRRLPGMADRVRLVHKHFPLDQACNPMIRRPFHKRACEFSLFAECAGKQGKFWEANDALLAALEGKRAGVVELGRIAARLGLDAPRLKACMKEGEARQVVNRDIEDGLRLKVAGTPTYFVGDKRHEGMLSAEKLEALLAAACGGGGQEQPQPQQNPQPQSQPQP